METVSPLRPRPRIVTMSLLPYSVGQAITSPVYAVREQSGKEYVAIFITEVIHQTFVGPGARPRPSVRL